MDEALTPIIVATIGLFQVFLAIYLGRRSNKAMAERDEANATESIGSTYATLVDRLEIRLERLEKSYTKLYTTYEEQKTIWECERKKLIFRIRQ